MIDEPAQHAPVELDLLDGQGWPTVYWAEIERRIGPLFARLERRARHGLSGRLALCGRT